MAANKSDEEVMSTQKSLQSSHDPGWNDPPKWAYTPSSKQVTSGTTPTKRLLNKRVAFPLSSSSSIPKSSNPLCQPQPQLLGNLPPPPTQLIHLTSAPHAPLVAPSSVSMKNSEIPSEVPDKDQLLLKTLENLENLISSEFGSNSKVNEAKERLEIMTEMWKEGKFNDDVMNKIYLISEELKLKNIEKADEIHISLTINHASCTKGISLIRHLIFELRNKYSQTENNLDGKVQPVLLLDPSSSMLK